MGVGSTPVQPGETSPFEVERERGALRWVTLRDGTLRGDPRNPRDNVHAVDDIADSIRRFGFGAPVVARPDPDRPGGLVVVAGHTRLAAAVAAGVERVPVRVLDLDEAEGRALMIADNKHGETARWNDAALGSLLGDLDAEGVHLGGLGFDSAELDALLADAGEDEGTALDPPDTDDTDQGDHTPIMVEPPTEPVSRRGEVYALGRMPDGAPRHVLVCGDSLEGHALDLARVALVDIDEARHLAVVVRAGTDDARAQLDAADKTPIDLVFTDPPYAIYGSSTGIDASIMDDKMVVPFFRRILSTLSKVVPLFGQVYMCCDWRSWPAIHTASKGGRGGSTMSPKNLLVWDKGGAGLGGSWANTYELIGYFVHTDTRRTISDQNVAGVTPVLGSNVLRYTRPTGNDRHHNAAKPVPLIREIIQRTREGRERIAARGDDRAARVVPLSVVGDLFGGSGSTLFAAHAEGHRCILVEIEPAWCDVIRARWTAHAAELGIDPGDGALDLPEGDT